MTDLPNDTTTTIEKIKEKEENDFTARFLRPYCKFLVRYPFIVVLVVVIILILSVVISTIGSLGAKAFPDFSKPVKGFEPRGTTLSSRGKSLNNLRTAFNEGKLTGNATAPVSTSKRRRRSSTSSLSNMLGHLYSLADYVDGFFLVYKLKNNEGDFLTLTNMKSLCKLHREKVEHFANYNGYFFSKAHHLPNYIALLNKRSTCDEIENQDVTDFADRLRSCRLYYSSGYYKSCIDNSNVCSMDGKPIKCFNHTNVPEPKKYAYLMYNTFHFFVSSKFVNDPNSLKLTGSLDMLSIWSTQSQIHFMKPLYETTLKQLDSISDGVVQLAAFDMYNFRFSLFQTEILIQSLYIITAIILVILFIWFYSGSLFVGLMTFACIIIALAVSYFVYGRVFDMDFFPFLNMVTLIFIVGIGADDAFVYTGIWQEAKGIYKIKNPRKHEDLLIKWTIHSLRHAVLAMLVTSLTTAAAFYANVSSAVTSVKCFGVFCGTSIIVNYMLMLTLFPAVVIMHDKYFAPCMNAICPCMCKSRTAVAGLDQKDSSQRRICAHKIQDFIDKLSKAVFQNYLPKILINLRYVWVVLLGLLGIGGLLVTFWKPGMNPPSTGEFQMFTSNSPLERFTLDYKKQFVFGVGSGGVKRELSFVFGVNAVDNGNKFNPDDGGKLELQSGHLDIGAVQIWLRQFCRNLQNASFTTESYLCNELEKLYRTFSLSCSDVFAIPGCCNYTLPMQHATFERCFRTALIKGQSVQGTYYWSPLFDQSGQLRTFTLSAETIYAYSDKFDFNKDAYNTIDSWFKEQMKNVSSSSFASGWWIMNMQFYDLQVSLFEGSQQSLGIAIGVAFAVILCTTFNVLLSFYSILTITFIISVTIGTLVLQDWRLNILESIIFSVAAGLSADFTLHYSVAYQGSLIKKNRVDRVKRALLHIGPAIMMGAFTTFVAGIVMLPSHVLSYFQMAQFLMLVMFVSWLYSTFFFLPLCAICGPTGTTGQLVSFGCCRKDKNNSVINGIEQDFALKECGTSNI